MAPKRRTTALSTDEDRTAQFRHSGRTHNKKARTGHANKTQESDTHAFELLRLQKKAKELQKKISQQRGGDDSDQDSNDAMNTVDCQDNNDNDLESEDDDDTIHFAAASSITAMQTVVTPTVPRTRIDLTRIHRKQSLASSTPKTPRQAFLTIPVENDSGPEGEQVRSAGTGISPSPIAMFVTPSRPLPSVAASKKPTTALEPATSSEPTVLPVLAFAADCRLGNKAKADDYNSEGKAIILRADAYYEAKIIGVQGFPKSGTKITWAQKAFQDACRVANKKYASDKRIEQLIYSRGSRVRGDILRHVEEAVITVFGFSKDSRKKTQNHNLELYNKLSKETAFAFKDTVKLTGFAESPVFQLILRLVCFGQGDMSRGIVFSRFFNPVSLETLALFMTQINHVMHQWSSGLYERHGKKDAFTEAANSKIYSGYLQDLQKWEAVNPAVVLNIRKRMYTRAREKSGIDPSGINAVITGDLETRIVSELAARTGETDTEDEDKDEDEDEDEDEEETEKRSERNARGGTNSGNGELNSSAPDSGDDNFEQ